MSIHIDKSKKLAMSKGAAAGYAPDSLWKMPKRELLEIALHFAALSTGEYDDAIRDGRAIAAIFDEREILRENGLI